MSTPTIGRILAGSIAGYEFAVVGDEFSTWRSNDEPIRSGVQRITHQIPGWQKWLTERHRTITVGWGRFVDDAEVIYLYDKGDDYFGYAINLDCDWCSEWGYAPFSVEQEGDES